MCKAAECMDRQFGDPPLEESRLRGALSDGEQPWEGTPGEKPRGKALFRDVSPEEVPEALRPWHCDYCQLKSEGKMREATSAAQQQRTCPVCHTECLSGRGS